MLQKLKRIKRIVRQHYPGIIIIEKGAVLALMVFIISLSLMIMLETRKKIRSFQKGSYKNNNIVKSEVCYKYCTKQYLNKGYLSKEDAEDVCKIKLKEPCCIDTSNYTSTPYKCRPRELGTLEERRNEETRYGY